MNTQFSALTTDSRLSETQYYSVVKIAGNKVQLENQHGDNIVVDKDYAEKCLTSADQFSAKETINKTKAAELLISNPGVVMQVMYSKAVKEVDVTAEIMEAYETSTPKTMADAVKKAVKKAIAGQDRLITGYHTGSMTELGRVNFTDMMLPKGEHNLRQLDPRTIQFIVLRGTKYTVK